MTSEEAIDKLEQAKRYSKYLSDDEIAAIVMAINILEQTRWIPVSERLPEENGRYLVYLNTKVFPIRILDFTKNLNEISLDFKSKKAGWYDYDSEYGFFEWTEVEAWMPLPQPYKVEKENKK